MMAKKILINSGSKAIVSLFVGRIINYAKFK